MKKTNKDNEAKQEYFETMIHNLNTALIMVSKGRAWIEFDNEKEKVKMTGITQEDAKQAGIIQQMFNKAIDKKQFPIEEVQKALDYFGWRLYLVEEGNTVSFRGEDRFLLVQIGWCMGGIDSKKYAGMYRDAVEENERIYF